MALVASLSTLVAAGEYGNYGSYGSTTASALAQLASSTTSAIASASSVVSSQSNTDTGDKTVQIVQVSDNNSALKFFPETIEASVGSIVQFQFYPKNHTITESSFADPCKPLAADLTRPDHPGQKSGFVPVTADTQFRPVYNLLVNDTKPIWIFCGQQPHCAKGMVMVINQNASDTVKTLENYKKAAAALLPASSGANTAYSSASTVSASAAGSVSSSASSVATPPASTAITTGGTATVSLNTGGPTLASSSASRVTIPVFTGAAQARQIPELGRLGGLLLGLVALL